MKNVLKQHRKASIVVEDGKLSAHMEVKLGNARDRKNALDFAQIILKQVKEAQKKAQMKEAKLKKGPK